MPLSAQAWFETRRCAPLLTMRARFETRRCAPLLTMRARFETRRCAPLLTMRARFETRRYAPLLTMRAASHAQIIAQHVVVDFQFRRAAGEADRAFVQDMMPVGHREGGAQVLLDQEDGKALALEAL